MAKREGTFKLPNGESARWRTCKGTIRLTYGKHERAAYLGGFGFNPEALARILLEEIIADVRAPRVARVDRRIELKDASVAD